MVNKPDKNVSRLRRHRRVRGKISGTAACPRLDVFRSSKHILCPAYAMTRGGVTLAPRPAWIKILKGSAAISRPLPRRSVWPSRSVLLTRASRKRCMTAAALYITAVSRLWLRGAREGGLEL